MPGCGPPSAATAWNTSRRTTAGTSCWASTNASSRRSGTPADDSALQAPINLLFDAGDRRRARSCPCRFRDRPVGLGPVAVGCALAPRPNLVALDHLVQRRRLNVQQLGGALLNAARRLERRLDQTLFEV